MGFTEVDNDEIGVCVCALVQSIGLKAVLLIHLSLSEDDGEQSCGSVAAQQRLPSSSSGGGQAGGSSVIFPPAQSGELKY